MKQGEFVITAILVLVVFGFGFYNITNSPPNVSSSQMNTSVSIEASSTNESVNLQVINYDTKSTEEEVMLKIDTLMVNDTIVELTITAESTVE